MLRLPIIGLFCLGIESRLLVGWDYKVQVPIASGRDRVLPEAQTVDAFFYVIKRHGLEDLLNEKALLAFDGLHDFVRGRSLRDHVVVGRERLGIEDWHHVAWPLRGALDQICRRDLLLLYLLDRRLYYWLNSLY